MLETICVLTSPRSLETAYHISAGAQLASGNSHPLKWALPRFEGFQFSREVYRNVRRQCLQLQDPEVVVLVRMSVEKGNLAAPISKIYQ